MRVQHAVSYLSFVKLHFHTNIEMLHMLLFGVYALESITVKPVCNDHLYNEIYYLWFIQ